LEEENVGPTAFSNSAFAIEVDDEELLQCFLLHPQFNIQNDYPLDYRVIRQEQQQDQELLQALQQYPALYPVLDFHGIQLICHRKVPNEAWRIEIPTVMLDRFIEWYHKKLSHAGMTRLENTIKVHFFHPQLRKRVDEIVGQCDACQRYKVQGRGYGELPPREQANVAPWDEVAVDCIGPWKIEVNGQIVEFNALTCVDPVTCFPEALRINNRTAQHVGMRFENEWISRYPRPLRCIHDAGGEFTAEAFQHVLQRNGIKDVPTTVKNPQSNAICERMHQTVANTLRILTNVHPPQDIDQANEIIDTCLATAMHAVRSTVHRSLMISPGAFVFQRDMFLDVPLIANLEMIRQRRQVLINERLLRSNLKRRSFDYEVGQQVLIFPIKMLGKMQAKAFGPFPILQIHVNGNVTIRRGPNMIERINIRRIKPYRSI
jgi:hypothetical protein